VLSVFHGNPGLKDIESTERGGTQKDTFSCGEMNEYSKVKQS